VTGVGNILLDVGFAAIWAVVVVETIVLLDVLRLSVRLKAEMYAAMPELMKHERLAGGTLVEFEAADLVTGATVRSADLHGAPSALLFMTPDGSEEHRADWLAGTIAGLRHKGEGRLCVICDGSRDACSELSRLTGADVPVLLDSEGRIRGRFLVSATPAAVLLDSDARIAQYGMPEQVPNREKEVV
jgi:hypothetical protein